MKRLKQIRSSILESKMMAFGRTVVYSIKPPGFAGISLAEVLQFFFHGIQKHSVTNRAAAVSFKFFMAIFPGIIFLVTLIPYLPIANFHQKILITIEGFLPDQIYPMIERTVVDVVKKKQTGLLSLGFFIAAFFSTNGMNGLMKAFNESAFVTETRKGFRQRLVAIGLTLFVVVSFIFTVTFLVVTNRFLFNLNDIIAPKAVWVFVLLKWFVIFAILYFTIATIFYFAPARNMRWTYFSAGALAATLFVILFTWLISVYITNFNSYNKIYGLLGAFPIILIWIFLTSLSLLIGFELNVSIRHAELRKK